MTSVKEPKIPAASTIRKLRQEVCALADEATRLRGLLAATADHATRCAVERDRARRLLKSVWEAATDDRVPFFERLGLLRPLVPRVVEELKVLEDGPEISS